MPLLKSLKKKFISFAGNPKLFIDKAKKRLVQLMTNGLTHLLFDLLEKLINPYPNNYKHEAVEKGYSVVVISGGQDLVMLENSLQSIANELTGTLSEIVLVGPSNIKLRRSFGVPIKFWAYHDLKFLSPLITRKKNIGVSLCRYDKVVICHDYILFEPGWQAGWKKFGDNFEVAINIINDQDGSRFRDWLVLDYPGVGAGFLPYHVEATPYQYISGTYFVVKRDFYLANLLDERLRWGEGEDIEWSKRVRLKTIFKFNSYSQVRCAKLKGPTLIWQQNNLVLEKLFSNQSN